MNITKIPADVLFRVYTSCAGDTRTLILDIRPHKDFKKSHVIGSYSIRLAANGQALLDSSKNTYDYSWSKDCWWDKHVVVYGEADLKRSHPVVTFLANDNHAKSVNVYSEGLEAFEKLYPFLVTASTKANASRRYPGEIIPKLLYLGDWAHATDHESLGHLKITRILTIHNNPENLKPPSRLRHKQLVLADVETEDISKYFNESYTFIEEAKAAHEGVLVHCGAGVSRSSALCIAYLMRKFMWPAARAKAHCAQRRSIVQPNDGFWRSLCAFEGQLGIQDRSDPTAVSGFSGLDASAPKISEDAAGEKVVVTFMSMAKVREMEAAEKAAKDAAANGSAHSPEKQKESSKRKRDESQSSDHDPLGGEKQDRHKGGNANEGRDSNRRDSRAERDGNRKQSTDRHRSKDSRRESSPIHNVRQHRGDKDRHDTDRRDHREYDRDRRRRISSGERSSRDSRRHRDDHDRRDKDKRQRQEIGREQGMPRAIETDVRKPAAVILESSKEGKAIGRLEMSLHNPHQRCVFGRLPSNEVVLEHLSISRQHAQLSLDASDDLLITDLGSAHQTNVDGVWIRPHQARAVPVGSVFKLGGSTREFKVIMTPKERRKIEARTKQLADYEEARKNTENPTF